MDTPPPTTPSPTIGETAAASREQVSAAAQLLAQSRTLAELSQMGRVSELADTWERRLITAQQQIIAGALAILIGKDVASDLSTEGRRATQAATMSTVVMRVVWVMLGLVAMVGGGYGVNVALDAAERGADVAAKAEDLKPSLPGPLPTPPAHSAPPPSPPPPEPAPSSATIPQSTDH